MTIAHALGASDAVIGLTRVAADTLHREAFASLATLLCAAHSIAVGNALGSNRFNGLGCRSLGGNRAGTIPRGIGRPDAAGSIGKAETVTPGGSGRRRA